MANYRRKRPYSHTAAVLVGFLDDAEQLIARSQAKRLLTKVKLFKTVVLDFTGVISIGQAFADEIFRVFANKHPMIELLPINANKEVQKMISRAKSVKL